MVLDVGNAIERARPVPYWQDSTDPLPDRSIAALPEQADVVVIGGGMTGLSASLALARKGCRVVLLEQGKVGSGASTRNGGICTNGPGLAAQTLLRRYGSSLARRYYSAFVDAVDFVENLIRTEGIDCQFKRFGKLTVAVRSSHMRHLEAEQQCLAQHFEHSCVLLSQSDLRKEIGSDLYQGALLDVTGAGFHIGRYVAGLARAAESRGAVICEQVRVNGVEPVAAGKFHVRASGGGIEAPQVLIATDSYTDQAFPSLRRRLAIVGSFIIATEPMDGKLADSIIPNRRTVSDTRNIGHYYRLVDDDRLIFGGRARFALSSPESDRKSGQILLHDMVRIFPQLGSTRIEYVWGGSVGFTFDRIPHAGQMGGLYYAIGYCGRGNQMASYMGNVMAEVMDGHPEANPWSNDGFRSFPSVRTKAWFLPFVGWYYRLKDLIA